MPNYVRNILELYGPEERVEALKARMRGDNGDVDFNAIIPMPRTLDIPHGSGTNRGMLAAKYLRGMISPEDFEKEARGWLRNGDGADTPDAVLNALVRDGRCDVNLGEVALDNIHDHGFPNWYRWCLEHWNTKWNALNITVEGAEIRFDTAWAAPLPVIARLADEFPDLRIEHYWADESVSDNCGQNTHMDGETASNWGEALDIFVRCWKPSGCLERDVDGYWQEAECGGRARCG